MAAVAPRGPVPAGKADPAVLLRLSAMRRRSLLQATNIQGGGWMEEWVGGGGKGCMGQKLNLSVLSLNVKRELLRSVTFYIVFNPTLSWQTRG